MLGSVNARNFGATDEISQDLAIPLMTHEHLTKPLANFSIRLPNDWGMPLGWAITFIPFAIIIAGLLFNMLWMSRGIPFKMVRITGGSKYCK